jgi:hypothetical protein
MPGCFPTRNQINSLSSTPVYVINGFDYQEALIDARGAGGSLWRIRYGLVDPRAVRVKDMVSGRSIDVDHGVFALAVMDPHPIEGVHIHLVALDSGGKVVAKDPPVS